MWPLSARRPQCVCAVAALLAAVIVGCVDPSPRQTRLLRVLVRDERTEPLAGVAVEVEGIRTTSTGADGTATVSLAGEGAPRARVAVLCPSHLCAAAARHVARSATAGAATLELTFVCRPRLRTVLVVARVSGGEGLTLRADGAPLGTVDADGTLHARLQRPPDSDLRLMLDTGQRALSPQNPAREIRLGDRDELVVFEEQLQPVTERGARILVAPSEHAAATLPYASRANR
jgi:hypothetical protein